MPGISVFCGEAFSIMETRDNQRVLVVEDNSALATVLKYNLEQAGFDVVHAANGRVAYELVQRDRSTWSSRTNRCRR